MKYTKENLQEAVNKSKSMADVIRHFGLKPSGGSNGWLKTLTKRYDIDTSHFVGKAHNKGKVSNKRKNAKEILVKTGKMQHGWKLRRALLEIGRKYECDECLLWPDEWNNKPLNLVVDHINGDNTDHRPINLRFLCPNCHSQTDTYAGKNNKRKRMTSY